MQHKINASIQIVPKTTNNNSYELVDKAIEIIKSSKLKHRVTPMDTIIEGHYDEIMAIFKQAQQAVLDAGAGELIVNMKFHIRNGGDVSFEEKTNKYKG